MGCESRARTRGVRESTCSMILSKHGHGINRQAAPTYNLFRLKEEGVERLESDMGVDRFRLVAFYQYRGECGGEVCC